MTGTLLAGPILESKKGQNSKKILKNGKKAKYLTIWAKMYEI